MKLEGRGPGLFNAGGGTIEVTEDGVVINKKNTDMSGGGGLLDVAIGLATSTKGGVLLPYHAINSVSISEGSWASTPFIQVLTVGEVAISDGEVALKTPSCLPFKKNMLADFRALKDEIEKRVASSRQKPQAATASTISIADEIRKLGELLQAGLLMQAEFDAKKKELLGI